MSKKIKYTRWYEGDTYEIVPAYAGFIGMMCVDIRKVVHPNWKFFRSELVRIEYFNIDDFETMEEGCDYCFDKYIKEYERVIARQKKLEKFFENA